MYESITYEVILGRMLDRVSNDMDKREGSIIYDALAPAAVELQLMYIEFDDMINEAFGDTASREFLIRRAAERGITPFPSTKALLQGEFTPTTIDVLGKRFSLNKLNYVVTAKKADGVYQVQCETEGGEGNQYLGDMIPIDYIDGLQTARLTAVLIPGEDEEETEDLRTRYFSSFEEKAFGGNRKDYLEKTNAIAGVGSTKVTPIWKGGGTVKLTILNSNFDKASTTLIQTVQTEIDPTQDGQGWGVAPIGHVVTVDTANEIKVNISTSIVFDSGYSWDNTKEQAIETIKAYMLELRKAWANQEYLTVRVAQIETRLLAIQGILDISNTNLNGSTSNLTLTVYDIPVLGGITA